MNSEENLLKLLKKAKSIDRVKVLLGKSRLELGEPNDKQKEIIDLIDKIIEMEESELKLNKRCNVKEINILYRKLVGLTGPKGKLIRSASKNIRGAHRVLIENKSN